MKRVIWILVVIMIIITNTCLATAKVPISASFDLQEFVQKFNNRHMEESELLVVSVSSKKLNNGLTRYKCILSDNYSYLSFDTRGNTLYGLFVLALAKEGKYQRAIHSLYSAAKIIGAPGTRDDFLDAMDAVFDKNTARCFARESKGYGFENWVVEARTTARRDFLVGIAVWKD